MLTLMYTVDLVSLVFAFCLKTMFWCVDAQWLMVKCYQVFWFSLAEVVEHACGMATLQMGEFVSNVSNGIDTYSIREPLGVCAGICPFNFPAMIPLWVSFLPFLLYCYLFFSRVILCHLVYGIVFKDVLKAHPGSKHNHSLVIVLWLPSCVPC